MGLSTQRLSRLDCSHHWLLPFSWSFSLSTPLVQRLGPVTLATYCEIHPADLERLTWVRFANFHSQVFRFARPCLQAQACSFESCQPNVHRMLRVVAHCAHQSLPKWQGIDWRSIFRSKKVARQRGNGIADSLSSRSGNLVRLVLQWLLLVYPLRALEMSSRPVKCLFQVTLVDTRRHSLQ
jgi:hypothetical protein